MNKDAICYKSDCADTAAATLKALQSYAPKKVLSSVRRYFRFRLKLKMASGVNLIAFGLTPTAIKSFQGCVLIDIWEYSTRMEKLGVDLVEFHVAP